jgi:radical SAM protein with 4Fe4S-binding SPASM domain
MEQLIQKRDQRAGPSSGPVLVAELIKCPATIDELEPFFNRWRFADEAHVAGLHSYGGQFQSPAAPGWATAPPRRRPCARIARRLTILADGTVPQCDIDIQAAAPIGRLEEEGLDRLWRGQANLRLQSDHREQSLAGRAMCRACDQWNRP